MSVLPEPKKNQGQAAPKPCSTGDEIIDMAQTLVGRLESIVDRAEGILAPIVLLQPPEPIEDETLSREFPLYFNTLRGYHIQASAQVNRLQKLLDSVEL